MLLTVALFNMKNLLKGGEIELYNRKKCKRSSVEGKTERERERERPLNNESEPQEDIKGHRAEPWDTQQTKRTGGVFTDSKTKENIVTKRATLLMYM